MCVDDFLRERVLDELLDRTLQWACTVFFIVAQFHKEVLGFFGHLDAVSQAFDALNECFQFQINDGVDVVAVKALEYHHVINPVQKFGAECSFQRRLDDCVTVGVFILHARRGAKSNARSEFG